MVFVISVLFLIIPIVSALEVSVEAPSEVDVDEEFIVSLEADTDNVHDVKVYVEDQESSPKTISQISDDGNWQSSYYYVKESWPAQKEFQVRISKSGEWDLCARLRNKTPSTPVCLGITVLAGSSNEEESNQKEFEESQDHNQAEGDTVATEDLPDNGGVQQERIESKSLSVDVSPEPLQDSFETGQIVLNTISSPAVSNEVLITREETKRLYMVYAFTFVCVVIIILLAMKQL